MSEQHDNCRDCHWFNLWGREEHGADGGECKRRSPVLIHRPSGNPGDLEMYAVNENPRVGGDEWCGEFKERK